MPERFQSTEAEVLDHVTFHKQMAIRRTQDGDALVSRGIFGWIEAGDHLIEVKENVPEGEWQAWIASEYPKGLTQAKRYMRAARIRRRELEDDRRHAAGLDPETSLREYLGDKPRNRDVPDGVPKDEPTTEPENEQVFIALPSGQQVTPEEAKEEYEEALEKLNEEKAKAERVLANANRAKERARDAEAKAKEKLQKQQAKVNADFRDAVEASFKEQLADLHARYDIEETPTIFEVDGAHFLEAVAQSRDRREQEILELLAKFFPAVSSMRQYEPEEAARACLNWPSEDRAKEAIEEIAEWLSRVVKEMRALTTPGVLRVAGGRDNET